jgi:hypothetical protein
VDGIHAPTAATIRYVVVEPVRAIRAALGGQRGQSLFSVSAMLTHDCMRVCSIPGPRSLSADMLGLLLLAAGC